MYISNLAMMGVSLKVNGQLEIKYFQKVNFNIGVPVLIKAMFAFAVRTFQEKYRKVQKCQRFTTFSNTKSKYFYCWALREICNMYVYIYVCSVHTKRDNEPILKSSSRMYISAMRVAFNVHLYVCMYVMIVRIMYFAGLKVRRKIRCNNI